MTITLIVGAFGGLGAVSRYLLDRGVQSRAKSFFPFGTFAVNMLGATMLGAIDALGALRTLPASYVAVLGVGFIGGFTTFSTLMYESFFLLISRGRRLYGLTNIIVSVVLGVTLYFIAFILTKELA